MTMQVKIRCDGCAMWLEIDYPEEVDYEIEQAGWKESPDINGEHYCANCYKTAVKNHEFENID